MQRKWQVSLIVVAGVFMSSLDLFIVNIAFPAISKHFGGASLSIAVLGAERLRDRVRRAARAGRALGGRVRAQARVPARPGDLRARPARRARAAPSVGVLVAARVVQAVGRRADAADLARADAAGVRAREAPRRDRRCGPRAAASPRPPARRSAACSCRPTGGSCSSSTSRSAWPRLAAGARTLRERREQGAGRPDLLGALTLIVAIGALVVAIVKGQEWGWGSPRDHRAAGRAGGAAAAALAALGAPPDAGRRAGDAARAQLRARRRRLGLVLRRLRRDAARRRAVPDRRLARGRADRRADAVPGPGHGGRVRDPSARLGRAVRLPAARRRRLAAVRGRLALVHHADGRHARTTSSEFLPGNADHAAPASGS